MLLERDCSERLIKTTPIKFNVPKELEKLNIEKRIEMGLRSAAKESGMRTLKKEAEMELNSTTWKAFNFQVVTRTASGRKCQVDELKHKLMKEKGEGLIQQKLAFMTCTRCKTG